VLFTEQDRRIRQNLRRTQKDGTSRLRSLAESLKTMGKKQGQKTGRCGVTRKRGKQADTHTG